MCNLLFGCPFLLVRLHCRCVPPSMYCCFTSGSYFCFEKRAAEKNHLPATINNGLAGKSHRKQMKNVAVIVFFWLSKKIFYRFKRFIWNFKKLYVHLHAEFITIERTFEVMEFIENLQHQTKIQMPTECLQQNGKKQSTPVYK